MMLRRILLFTILGVFSLSTINCSFRRYEKREVSEYRVNVNGKTKVILENVSGNIKVYKGDSASGLVIRAEKIAKVRKRDLAKPFTEVWIVIDSASEVVRIRADYQEKGKSIIKFKVGDRDVDIKAEVNYDITLPPWIKFNVENVNGDLSLDNISNDLDVTLLNGDVNLDNVPGSSKFDITNGKMKGTLDSTKGMIINIINGGVDFKLDSSFSANFKIETVNGKVTQENLKFDVLNTEKNYLRGKIGSSNAEVKIDIVNGKVKLAGK